MPSGRTHLGIFRKLTYVIAPLALGVGGVLHFVPEAIVFLLGWLVGGIVTPDIDYDGLDHIEHRLLRKNRLVGWVWVALWFPLARLQTHRGISHYPVLGVISRMGWLLAVVQVLVLPFVPQHDLILITWVRHHPRMVLVFLVGQEMAVDLSHIAVDRLVTRWKRRRRRAG